jgi:hypothetical protein
MQKERVKRVQTSGQRVSRSTMAAWPLESIRTTAIPPSSASSRPIRRASDWEANQLSIPQRICQLRSSHARYGPVSGRERLNFVACIRPSFSVSDT